MEFTEANISSDCVVFIYPDYEVHIVDRDLAVVAMSREDAIDAAHAILKHFGEE